MEKTVKNRLAELVAEKARIEDRKITNAVISEEVGLGINTVGDWMSNRVKRYDVGTIAKICTWVPCDIKDLLILQDAEGNKRKANFALEVAHSLNAVSG
jgi:DNA-binding Xre family transcriptional regulator